MKSIRNRRDGYALLFAASILLAIWHCITFMLKEVIFLQLWLYLSCCW